MRRKEKEITDKSVIESIIRESNVCRLGLVDGDMPYVLPLCFGFRDGSIYIHGALTGKKIDILKKNPNVCFEVDINTEVMQADKACEWDMKFRSVIGYGKAVFLDDPDEKREALDIIMGQYSDRSSRFTDSLIEGTGVIKIAIDNMTGKQSGF